jgi:hypothetical protein
MRVTQMLAIALCLVLSVAATTAEMGPEETVKRYLTAFQAGDFDAAYPFVSKAMSQNKDGEDWAKEQQWIMQMAEVKIFEFHVYPGKVEGDKAYVPNLLSSQDKFLNQLGVEEHELYTLIREDERWKINQQQIVENEDRKKWFPGAKP